MTNKIKLNQFKELSENELFSTAGGNIPYDIGYYLGKKYHEIFG